MTDTGVAMVSQTEHAFALMNSLAGRLEHIAIDPMIKQMNRNFNWVRREGRMKAGKMSMYNRKDLKIVRTKFPEEVMFELNPQEK